MHWRGIHTPIGLMKVLSIKFFSLLMMQAKQLKMSFIKFQTLVTQLKHLLALSIQKYSYSMELKAIKRSWQKWPFSIQDMIVSWWMQDIPFPLPSNLSRIRWPKKSKFLAKQLRSAPHIHYKFLFTAMRWN